MDVFEKMLLILGCAGLLAIVAYVATAMFLVRKRKKSKKHGKKK